MAFEKNLGLRDVNPRQFWKGQLGIQAADFIAGQTLKMRMGVRVCFRCACMAFGVVHDPLLSHKRVQFTPVFEPVQQSVDSGFVHRGGQHRHHSFGGQGVV